MIIGNGDIAKALMEGKLEQEDITYFASGVSNSSTADPKNFARERLLLANQSTYQHLVYFSSLCIYYSGNKYAQHKHHMEECVKCLFPTYTIIRIGNITWGKNKNTIVNWFKLCYQKGIEPYFKDEYRYLISKEEFLHWMKKIPTGMRNEMNIPGEMVHVNEIWRRVCNGEYK